jgi:hypothetical protein
MSMKKLLLACALLIPTISHAQIFSLRRVASSTANTTILALFDAEIQKVENEINADLPTGDPKRLMEGMANSQAASAKGLATDYISHFDKVLIGAGLGLGADLEENKEADSDLSGIGVTGGLQLGLNMSLFADKSFLGLDPNRTTVMMNFFSYNLDRDFDDNSAEIDMLSFGFSGTYKWIDGNGSRLFGWDGVRLHTGYQYTKADINFSGKINEAVNATSGGSTISGTITGTPKATIETSTHSIPLEISSGVNFLWIMSFYGGVGTDFNMGSAKGKGDLNTQDSVITCNGAPCGGETATVRSEANIDDKADVNPFFLRGFAGFQVNLPYIRLYAQGNKVFGTEVYSLATGLRLAF